MKDKREIHLVTNIHHLSASSRYVTEKRNALKLLCLESNDKNTGFVDMNVMMVLPCRFSQKTWKLSNKLFFCLISLSTVNVFNFIDHVGIHSDKYNIRCQEHSIRSLIHAV